MLARWTKRHNTEQQRRGAKRLKVTMELSGGHQGKVESNGFHVGASVRVSSSRTRQLTTRRPLHGPPSHPGRRNVLCFSAIARLLPIPPFALCPFIFNPSLFIIPVAALSLKRASSFRHHWLNTDFPSAANRRHLHRRILICGCCFYSLQTYLALLTASA